MNDQIKSKDAGERAGKVALDHEAAAQAVRDKTARLRALRLAQEAASPSVAAKPSDARVAGSRIGGKKKPTKAAAGKAAAEKAVPLSDWLATQQREGRNG